MVTPKATAKQAAKVVLSATLATELMTRARTALQQLQAETNDPEVKAMTKKVLASKLFPVDGGTALLELVLQRATATKSQNAWAATNASNAAKQELVTWVEQQLLTAMSQRIGYHGYTVRDNALEHSTNAKRAALVITTVTKAIGAGPYALPRISTLATARRETLDTLARLFDRVKTNLRGEYLKTIHDLQRSVRAIEAQKFGRLYANKPDETDWVRKNFGTLQQVMLCFKVTLLKGPEAAKGPCESRSFKLSKKNKTPNAQRAFGQSVKIFDKQLLGHLSRLTGGSKHDPSIKDDIYMVKNVRGTFEALDARYKAVATQHDAFVAFAQAVRAANFQDLMPTVNELNQVGLWVGQKRGAEQIALETVPTLQSMPLLSRFFK